MMALGFNEISILTALLREERYGLEIIKFMKEEHNKAISLGGLYTTLNRLEKKGCIQSSWGERTEIRKGNRRKYYKLTGEGRKALRDLKRSVTPLFDPEVSLG